jgi:hypothetical protein
MPREEVCCVRRPVHRVRPYPSQNRLFLVLVVVVVVVVIRRRTSDKSNRNLAKDEWENEAGTYGYFACQIASATVPRVKVASLGRRNANLLVVWGMNESMNRISLSFGQSFYNFVGAV